MNEKSCLARWLLSLAALLTLAGLSVPALANTYYVRTDGGTSVQCTGTADAPYPGGGTHQACAWNSLMEALPPVSYNQPNPAVIKGGDTLIIDAGSYMIGWNSNAVAEWGDNVCDAQYAPGCVPQVIPSGTASQPTRILGAGWDSGCTNPPQLWGTQGANQILSLDGASNIVIACLDLTDHSNCTINYVPNPAYSCNTKSAAYGAAQPTQGPWADKAIHAQDSSNVTLQDLNIHGFADQGVQAGRISNWAVTRVKVLGNGEAGWNGDLGGNNHTSTNSGTLTFTDLNVSWNGCQESYPPDGTYINCFGQNEGGYGDGFSEAWTGGNFVFIRPVFQYNMQDGLDLLYANGTGSVTVDRGNFGYNAGNDLKTSGNSTVTNSIFVAYCNAMQNSGMPIAGGGSSPVSGTMCRAGGGEVQDMTASGQLVTFAYNTMVGDPGCLYGGDPTSHETGAPLDSSDVYDVYNNAFIGMPSALPNASGGYACFTYFGDTQYATVNYANNLVWNTRNTNCNSTSIICKDPLFVNEAPVGFNANLLPSSPAIGNANRSVYSVAWDFYGNSRAATGPIDIGAVAYRGQAFIGSGSGDSPLPPSGGTQPASDAPAPTPPKATADPVSSKPGSGSYSGALRERLRDGSNRERYYVPGSTGRVQWSVGSWQPQDLPSQTTAFNSASATMTAASAAAEPTSAIQSPPATRSYLLVVFDWFADVYHKSRYFFQY